MTNKILNKYVYLVLIVIILAIIFQFLIQKDITDETSSVILNLYKEDLNYELENPGNSTVNVTITSQNLITGSVILEPKTSVEIKEEEFEAIGEEYE